MEEHHRCHAERHSVDQSHAVGPLRRVRRLTCQQRVVQGRHDKGNEGGEERRQDRFVLPSHLGSFVHLDGTEENHHGGERESSQYAGHLRVEPCDLGDVGDGALLHRHLFALLSTSLAGATHLADGPVLSDDTASWMRTDPGQKPAATR
ncbi:hypothetical protein [Micromonospora sp. LOL_021]|uniref:hypothetical protein n=1 Tax=Micromonospora sp. LOL_021 TaxID=3345417 RepID=UPI003A8C7737